MTDPDERALLAAVLAAPADDVPRLAYADRLEELDEPERAEFVRLQCELAAIGPDWQDDGPEESGPVDGRFVGGGEFVGGTFDRPPVGARITGRFLAPKTVRRIPGLRVIRVSDDRGSGGFQVNAKRDEHSGKAYRRVAALRKREQELLDRHWSAWIRGAGLVPDGWKLSTDGHSFHVWRDEPYNDGFRFWFRRGFVAHVTCPLAAWLEVAEAVCGSQPVERVTLIDREPEDGPSGWSWFKIGFADDPATLPEVLFDRLEGECSPGMLGQRLTFPTRQAALDALSAAALAVGREWAMGGRAASPQVQEPTR